MNSPLEWLALSLVPGLGPRGWKKLLDEYGAPGPVLNSSVKELQERAPGLNSKVRAGIQKDNLKKAAEKELRKADTLQVSIVTQADSAFPDLLKNI
ncbi:MAG: hypothetical protein GQ541_02675, partial [Desulfovibrionaceae bacterium]|nr:hypothetical protein [Desulfovibrionaceae bacterium]